MENNKKTSLVTGGAGFLGTNLCIRLLEMGHRVICFDNFSTGSISNIEKLMDNPFFILINGDVVDKHSFSKLIIYGIWLVLLVLPNIRLTVTKRFLLV